ncbi:HD domain-containing protein [Citrifermentans bremense]|uniref:HD domain-containing protein n=1 Tax=Citrifermentans bremense TaxID=60035 RepID=UPI000478C247|nr:HD domain-containing protein [Citrifermentans bremense]
MMIHDLIYESGSAFSGSYRIRSPRTSTSKNGSPFISLGLGDMTGVLKGYIWTDEYKGPKDLRHNDLIAASGTLRNFNNDWVAILHSAKRLEKNQVQQLSLIPTWWCPARNLLPRLHCLVNDLEILPLRGFLSNLFGDDSVTLPFLSIPASCAHHHSSTSGLLRHSLECAEIVKALPFFTDEERELGIVAALLHDIGKIRTLKKESNFNSPGYLLNHDLLTLEVISPYLKMLDEEWPDGGLALRYLLTWKSQKSRSFPLMTIAEAVNSADRISTGLEREMTAFSQLPAWRNATRSGPTQGFWRPQKFQESDPHTKERIAI